MTEEPVYIYQRGVGWVPAPAVETLSFEKEGHRITLYARKPTKGERWYAEQPGRLLSETRDALQGGYYTPGVMGNKWDDLRHWHDLLSIHDGPWVTVHVEKLSQDVPGQWLSI